MIGFTRNAKLIMYIVGKFDTHCYIFVSLKYQTHSLQIEMVNYYNTDRNERIIFIYEICCNSNPNPTFLIKRRSWRLQEIGYLTPSIGGSFEIRIY